MALRQPLARSKNSRRKKVSDFGDNGLKMGSFRRLVGAIKMIKSNLSHSLPGKQEAKCKSGKALTVHAQGDACDCVLCCCVGPRKWLINSYSTIEHMPIREYGKHFALIE
ncbi:hypothetical protein EHZ86_22095 [Aeromonas australiensis]|uniref:hypothetical protein n=1 Tax=Aeromonas australiensis TaxID=1114880 RepID=UPI001F3481BA|nr:hypothetical protein [Aeromonas australiensis]MCF3099836.1 hypothetical protein [Aeromonas australiensis]